MFLKKRWWTLWKSKEKKWSMIASKNIEVKRKAIYLLMNLIMHCLLQLILIRQRWSDVMMIRSDKNEKDKSLYSTVKYNFIWLKEKLLTLSLLKTKSETSLNASVEAMIHRLRSMTHQQLKITQDWVHYAIMLSYEVMLAFASMLDESTTHVSHHCAQIMNAATASNCLIVMIYHMSAIIETRRNKYVYQEL